ncbi:hypothetical protein DPMN_038540 [Dreissena polymorpha]|uniref:Paraneoplastic antigen Ma-like C-terminal domain-containing protein n=1 Tax=Dreissena polymorpha TaxID=45954 RepID=A0A9D4MH62_DREPO|nr:hypothetical protein DPMN_038540 [Dreissena polymorpha]
MATGSDRESRGRRRNIDDELLELQNARQMFIERGRRGLHVENQSTPSHDIMPEEERDQSKTPGRANPSGNEQIQENGVKTPVATRLSESLINRELSEMSIRRTQIETENQTKDTDVKARELKIKELALVERERKNKQEESRLKQYFEGKEFELKIKEAEFKRKCIEQTDRIAEQELRLREKETSLLERISRIERKLELKEDDLICRERFLSQKERESESPQTKTPLEENKYLADIERRIEMLEREKHSMEFEDSDNFVLHRQRSYQDNAYEKLNLSAFSGAVPVPKNEVSFEDLKLEVDNVKVIYSQNTVKQSLRKALRGQAKRKMLHMKPEATVEEIMSELDDNFGNVASIDTMLSKFLMAEQDQNETISEWGLRIEELLLHVTRKTRLDEHEKKDMLRKRFWRGLRNEELKNATRVHFESKLTYEELKIKLREEEFEIQISKDRGKQKCSRVYQSALNAKDEGDELLKQLIRKIEDLEKKVDDFKNERNLESGDHRNRDTSRHRGGSRGHGRGNHYVPYNRSKNEASNRQMTERSTGTSENNNHLNV